MKLILEKIRRHKEQEVAYKKLKQPVETLQTKELYNRQCTSLKQAIIASKGKGIIAEFKRQSPSKGNIHPNADVTAIVQGYTQEGAAALSILFDQQFFGAKTDDFLKARKATNLPLLQKEFIVDEYQLEEAKAIGADAILLIAKLHPVDRIVQLTDYAHKLGLEVLLETHTEEEVRLYSHTNFDLIGINNRNLNTFDVDIENSILLASYLPTNAVKIAESGIYSANTIKELQQAGFAGYLMGEYFMKEHNPPEILKQLQTELL